MKQEDVVASINSNVPLPKDGYAIQCVDEEFGLNKKQNLMITRKWQIINPQFVVVNGIKIDVLGLELAPQYMVTKVFKKDAEGNDVVDEEATKSAMARVFQDYKNLGLECGEIDENNPLLQAKGLVAHAQCGAEAYQPTKDPTPEQIAKGAKQGDPILDENNKPITKFRPKIFTIFGLSKVPAMNLAF